MIIPRYGGLGFRSLGSQLHGCLRLDGALFNPHAFALTALPAVTGRHKPSPLISCYNGDPITRGLTNQ